MKVFIIIVIYNGMRNNWLQKCFSSLENSTMPVQIIAVDNNSTDNSVDYIRNNFPQTILIESQTNIGFGGANNIGLKKAIEEGGDFFFLLNQDAWVESDTLEKLIAEANKNPQYGILSPLHFTGMGNALDFNFSLYISPLYCKDLYSDFVIGKIGNKIYESGFICAAAWLITKSCLKKIGGFSPIFFHYGEDDNYVHRLKYHNIKIGVVPSAKIFHDREQREKSHFKEKKESEKRSLLLKFSNPLSDIDLIKHIKILKFKKLKADLQLQLSYSKQLKEEIQFLEQYRDDIILNKNLTKSHQQYLFL